MKILKTFEIGDKIPDNARCIGVTTIYKDVVDMMSRSGQTIKISKPVAIYEIEEDTNGTN